MPDNPIPIVDFANARNGNEEEKKAVAGEIDKAFREVGFVYLTNHGVREEVLGRGFEMVRPSLHFPYPTANSTTVQDLLRPPPPHQTPRPPPPQRRPSPRLLSPRARESQPTQV